MTKLFIYLLIPLLFIQIVFAESNTDRSCENQMKEIGYHGGWLSLCDEARSFSNTSEVMERMKIFKEFNVSPFIAYTFAHSSTELSLDQLTSILSNYQNIQDELDENIEVKWYKYLDLADFPSQSKLEYKNHKAAIAQAFSNGIDELENSSLQKKCEKTLQNKRLNELGNASNKSLCQMIKSKEALYCVEITKESFNTYNKMPEHYRACSLINTPSKLTCYMENYNKHSRISAKDHIISCSK